MTLKILKTLSLLGSLLCVLAWAQGTADLKLAEISEDMVPGGGVKLLGVLALAVQILLGCLRFWIVRISGIYRLIVLNVLTLVLGVFWLHLQGFSWLESLLHAQTTAMAQVFVHQFFKQIMRKPKDDYVLAVKVKGY
jgi:hypothetical protein